MPDLMDRLYCSEQIHIPPTFPFIMKLYCKAAIRTQPYDLLKWSAAYFRALANGEEPPVKERIEYPPYDSPTGLTPGYIKMLIKQLGKDPTTTVSAQTLFLKWNCICLEDELLVKLLALMGAKSDINWLKFIAISCGYISACLTNTMILICEVLTEEPEGGMASVPLEIFNELYTYLAAMECGPLTEEEEKELEGIGSEEDVSAVAEKIRSAIYEGEIEEEVPIPESFPDLEEKEEMGEWGLVLPEKEDEKVEIITTNNTEKKGFTEEIGEVSSGEDIANGKKFESKESLVLSGEESENVELQESELAPLKKVEGIKESLEDDQPDLPSFQEPENQEEIAVEKAEEEKGTKNVREIKLEDIEDSIRLKIQEKLDMEKDSTATEEGFQDLSSYLIAEAEAAKDRTAEEIGYRIFKKYRRQEVPGIGPKIDEVDVEKVIDFMDYNSHKQEGMVMPRNIRHWMCPPLEKEKFQVERLARIMSFQPRRKQSASYSREELSRKREIKKKGRRRKKRQHRENQMQEQNKKSENKGTETEEGKKSRKEKAWVKDNRTK